MTDTHKGDDAALIELAAEMRRDAEANRSSAASIPGRASEAGSFRTIATIYDICAERLEAALAARGAGQGEAAGLIGEVWSLAKEAMQAAGCAFSGSGVLEARVAAIMAAKVVSPSSVRVGGWSKSDLETVARIIDPEIFEQAKDFPKVIGLSRWNRAFAKARAILALPAAPSQGEA